MFWQSTVADFLGSALAGLLLWWLVTRLYDLPKSRKEKREVVAVAYGLIERELKSASIYCEDLRGSGPDKLSAVPPITQAWETLHSTEAFKFFPAEITEKLVGCYSLIFRLSKDIELSQRLFLSEGLCPAGEKQSLERLQRLRGQTDTFTKQIAETILQVHGEFDTLLKKEVNKMSASERDLFDKASQTVGDDAPTAHRKVTRHG